MIQLKYSKTELVEDINDIHHPIFREVLKMYNLKGVDLNSIADIPSGTGLGSSSAFTVGLLNAVRAYIGIPVLIWIALVVAACFWFLYNKTRHGKYMYAIGGNEAAAEVAGVNVYATKIRIYILASCMFGLAGCLLAAKSGGASVNTAMGYELDAIAACTIGGVSTTGGVGTVPGVLVGVLVFELMKVALQFMNVNSSYTYIVQGLVIIVAVAIDIRKYLAKK